MLNPNWSKTELDRVEETLAELTPQPETFGFLVYPFEDVWSDMKQLETFKHTPEYKRGEERSDAKLLEKTFTDMAERGDWFSEDELYGEDPDYLALITYPTSEIDDAFNHIDLIGMISNETTGHETVPFAVDLTYNTDNEKMTKKFRWKHVHGKNANAPEGISEFGESYTDEDYQGKEVQRTKPLPLRFREGLKIPGFASAKYYEDRDNPWDPRYDKGRIDLMLRFVVGYSTDIADTLSDGKPNEEYRKRYGDQAYDKRRREYRNAERCAKWCTLYECSEQASNIRYMLENMSEDETKWMQPKELEKAKKQIVAMDTYFTKAIEVAKEKAQTDPDELSAMKYADRDIVRQAIMNHSSDTYIGKSWQ